MSIIYLLFLSIVYQLVNAIKHIKILFLVVHVFFIRKLVRGLGLNFLKIYGHLGSKTFLRLSYYEVWPGGSKDDIVVMEAYILAMRRGRRFVPANIKRRVAVHCNLAGTIETTSSQ